MKYRKKNLDRVWETCGSGRDRPESHNCPPPPVVPQYRTVLISEERGRDGRGKRGREGVAGPQAHFLTHAHARTCGSTVVIRGTALGRWLLEPDLQGLLQNPNGEPLGGVRGEP